MSAAEPNDSPPVRVWDLPTRLFHWALAVAVVAAFVSVEVFDNTQLHVRIGSVVLGLLLFRLVWGLVGSSTARFSRFVPTPARLKAYLSNPERFDDRPGHSPLGALSVLAMLLALAFQVGTGLFADDEIFTTGPLAKFVSSDFVSWATSLHHLNHNVIIALVLLHLAAIAFYRLVRRKSLVPPMIHGRTRMRIATGHEPRWGSPILAWLIAAASATIAWWIYRL
ncbi:MAG: cytochrome b/b6 domain-containing protein [Burkholderiaceae bacterium]